MLVLEDKTAKENAFGNPLRRLVQPNGEDIKSTVAR